MICDNCGAKIDEKEEYCPNCGMQLLDLKPNPKKKTYHKKSNQSKKCNSDSVEKPIKKKYYEESSPESPDYSQYSNEYEEEEVPEENYYEEDYKEKSGVGIGNIILILFIALVLGFIAGLLMFGSQSVPQIPGFKI